jgi:hypothetical protein
MVEEDSNNNSGDNNQSYNIKDNEQSGNVNWWFNELDSLGIKKNSSSNGIISSEYGTNNKMEPIIITSQQLEDLTDDMKQRFIRDYKSCYNE